MSQLKLACPTLFGLESIVAEEIRQLGYDRVTSTNGRVMFEADELGIARANINLRCAERVMVLIGEFEATSFEQLFQNVKAMPFEQWICKDDEFPVKGWSLNSALHSVPDCQSIIKKAVVERLKLKYKIDWFSETANKVQIQFSIMKNLVSVYLDTSGEGLHKRGYRENANEAPLKETLAAAMIMLSRFDGERAFYDPFCGSGTILIEAAMIASNMAPGLYRRYSAEKWSSLNKDIWTKARNEALDKIIKKPMIVHGYDIDEAAVRLTLENAKKASVGSIVTATCQDIKQFAPTEPRGVIVCNPPYGERMLEIKEAEDLYRQMGQVISPLHGFNLYVISASERFENLFGRPCDKKRKLYNGMIKCELFQYFRGR
jgi:putative N6-adenine-specific DNA methylase